MGDGLFLYALIIVRKVANSSRGFQEGIMMMVLQEGTVGSVIYIIMSTVGCSIVSLILSKYGT